MKSISRGIPSALIVLLTSSSALAAVPVVQIIQPTANQAVGDTLAVKASATADFVISGVTAQVGALSTTLPFSSGSYAGQLDISSLPIGPISLTVTATDSTSQTGSAVLALVHDHAPALQVLTPEGAVARPSLRLHATCTDADLYGCASITATVVNGPQIATVNGAALDQTVSLAAYLDKAIAIDIVATDSAGFSTTQRIDAYVDATPTLTEVAHGDGPIVDFDDTRILFGLPGSLVIRSRAGAVPDVAIPGVPVASGATISTGFLTPLGAIWTGGELRSGTTLTNNAQSGLVSRNGYAAWKTGTASNNPAGYYRDVATDTTTLAVQAGYDVPEADVAANGDAVFMWMPPAAVSAVLSRYRAGTVTQLTTVVYPQRPVTDGINVAYARHQTSGRGALKLFTAAGEIELAAGQALGAAPVPGYDYAVAGGWAAYTDFLSNQRVVYTRSPDGTVGLASPFAAPTAIDALSETGEVVYLVTQEDGNRRYKGHAGGGAPELVTNHQLGRARAVGGDFYVTLGASLLKLGPAPDLDAGVDGGGDDAGASSSGGSSSGETSSSSGGGSSGAGTSSSSGAASSSSGAGTSSGAATADGGNATSSGSTGSSSGGADDADGGGCSTTGSNSGSFASILGVVLGTRRSASRVAQTALIDR